MGGRFEAKSEKTPEFAWGQEAVPPRFSEKSSIRRNLAGPTEGPSRNMVR